MTSTTNIGTVPGQWFQEGSTNSTDVLVSFKDGEISIHFQDDAVKTYSVKDASISDYIKDIPLKISFSDKGILSIPDSNIAKKISSYRYPFGARVERNVLWWVPLIALSILVLGAISFFIVPSIADKIAPRIPKDVVVSIGDRAFEQVEGFFDFEIKTEEHELAEKEIQELGYKLLNNIEHEFDYQFGLVTTEGMINAFALPNGQIFVSYELYLELSEAELAAVLAHEIVHVEKLHGMQGLVASSTWFVISSFLLSGPGALAYLPAIVELAYTREHELEADCLAVEILKNSEYSPLALQDALLSLQDTVYGEDTDDHEENALFEIFSTHPHYDDRVNHVAECVGAETNTF